MLFTSTAFLFYFLPIVIIIYYALGFSKKLQNFWLLIASLGFYTSAEPKYIIGFFALILLNMIFALIIQHFRSKKILMQFSILFNIGILILFKYWNFFGNSALDILGHRFIPEISIIVPIGISFFFLRIIAYIVDVYDRKISASKNIIDLGLYFSFFPIVIAGPLMSFENFKFQLDYREHTKRRFSVGLCRFIVGLSKKVLLANTFALIANRIFDLSTIGASIYQIPASLAWLGAFTFLLQFYFDFSAYCDMAIGIGLMLGFKLPENFDYPVFSNTVTEFWSKFNITLFKWFDTYVMTRLSSKHNTNRDSIIKNTFLLWLAIGFWHGSDWTFLMWGVFNFVLIIAEDFMDIKNRDISPVILKSYTFLAISFGLVMFRCKDMYQAGIFIGNMFGKNYNGFFSDTTFMYLKEFWIFYILGILFALPIARKINTSLVNEKYGKFTNLINFSYPVIMIILFIITLSYITVMGQSEFIFYR